MGPAKTFSESLYDIKLNVSEMQGNERINTVKIVSEYVLKPVLNDHLQKRQKIDIQDQLLLNAGQKGSIVQYI